MTSPRLVLVGAPASGKTTVGSLVAERSGLAFTDTDALLVERLGLSLPEAWASLPPAEISAAETQVCLAALAGPGVVALGSAAVADPAVREALKVPVVVWLKVSVAQASRRLGMAALGMDTLVALRSRLDALLHERQRWYEEVADRQLDTDRLGVAAAAERVEQALSGGG